MPIPRYVIEKIKKSNDDLIEIQVSKGLFDSDIDELVDILNQNPHITSLSLYRNNLGHDSAPKLVKLIYINQLDLSSNNFDDDGILPLISKRTFSHLNLSRNNLSDKCVELILNYAEQSSFNISENYGISNDGIGKIQAKIQKNKNNLLQNKENLSQGELLTH